MGNLNIEYVSVDCLVPNETNAKKHSDTQIEEIARSIAEFGNCDPIGVWTNADGKLEIVEGHGRVQALKRLGETECPIIKLDFLTDEQRRAYTLVHNKLTLDTGFDEELLALELASLPDIDMEQFGFDTGATLDDFGIEFDIPDRDAPVMKSVAVYLTEEEYEVLMSALDRIKREDCRLTGGNETGDKICEVVAQWDEQRTSR